MAHVVRDAAADVLGRGAPARGQRAAICRHCAIATAEHGGLPRALETGIGHSIGLQTPTSIR